MSEKNELLPIGAIDKPKSMPTKNLIDGDKLKKWLNEEIETGNKNDVSSWASAWDELLRVIESGQFSVHSHEGDLTPEEALQEARGLWGDGADIKIATPLGKIQCLVYGYNNIGGENFKQLKGVGNTFREAFLNAQEKKGEK